MEYQNDNDQENRGKSGLWIKLLIATIAIVFVVYYGSIKIEEYNRRARQAKYRGADWADITPQERAAELDERNRIEEAKKKEREKAKEATGSN